MPVGLDITLEPERLSEGSAEEKAAFGLFVVRAHQRLLTEGFDAFIDASRKGPLVSGYHVAEWFAWNWWRLRWEGHSAAPDWNLAHKMTSIGEGYVWPIITVFSDGVRTALISSPSDPDAKPFRYLGALPTVVPSREFEAAVDAFVPKILARVDEAAPGSNLARIWSDILAERGDTEVAKRRRLEAFLGRDATGRCGRTAVGRWREARRACARRACGGSRPARSRCGSIERRRDCGDNRSEGLRGLPPRQRSPRL